MPSHTASDQAEARRRLLDDHGLRPGATVYTILRHVSSSGMTRAISAVLVRESQILDISYPLAQLVGSKVNERHGGITRGGCGMDMGFDLVYSLSAALWPDGFDCTGDRCPSNDHSNGDRDYTPGHVTHRAGGYALNQRWL